MPAVNWIKDELAEPILYRSAELLGLTIKYDMKMMKIDKLRVDESKRNNARTTYELDEDLVYKISTSMLDGSPIPYIVVTPSGLILGGNHRVGAAQLIDVEEVMAYIITNATKALQDVIARSLNMVTGKPPSKTERFANAIEVYLSKYKIAGEHVPLSAIAKQYMLSFEELQIELRIYETKKILSRAHVDAESLNGSTLKIISRLDDHPSVLVRAGEIASVHRLTIAEVRDLAKAMGSGGTIKDRIARAKDWKSIVSRSGNKRGDNTQSKDPMRDKLRHQIKAIKMFLTTGNTNTIGKKATSCAFTEPEQLGIITENDRLQYQHDAREIAKLLSNLFKKRK